MKSLLNTIKRAILLYQIRSLEITIDGQNKSLEYVEDRLLRLRIITALCNARIELTRLRSEYGATFPPGRRFIWGMV